MSTGRGIVVFDLDDTLYLERDFARSGYRASGKWLEEYMGENQLAEVCQSLFDRGQRTNIFDTAVATLGLPDAAELVPKLVDVYRGHQPEINLAADAQKFLSGLREGERTAIITDGPLNTQKNKVQALQLVPVIDLIVYTDVWGKAFWKPNVRSFQLVQSWANAAPAQLVYIADNPSKDFLGPRQMGWLTIRVLRPGRIHEVEPPSPAHEPHITLRDLHGLRECLHSVWG